jgi:predicted  nucleic acid-binding Zn-ribbon protein
MDPEMRETVAALLDLQDMEIVLQESRIVHQRAAPESMAAVEAKVRDLRSRVPESTLKRYDLLRRNGLGVARELAGVCGACRLNVPVGDLNRMRAGKVSWVCPNCGRFLLLSR